MTAVTTSTYREEERPIRFDGERRKALAILATGAGDDLAAAIAASAARSDEAVLAYAFVDSARAPDVFDRLGWIELGPAPVLVRPLRLGGLPAVLPFGGRPRAGVREITVPDPRITRLWDRFSVDVPVAIERGATYVNGRLFGSGAEGVQVLVLEDGDRYAIRALCAFRVDGTRATLLEVLHDRSVTGMFAAAHLVGLALRRSLAAGATEATAWSLPHSGSYPILARHLFRSAREPGLSLGVQPIDPEVAGAAAALRSWYLSALDLPP